jgi:hypothetical protein
MGAIRRAAAVGLLILLSVAVSAQDCVTGVRVLSSSTDVPNLIAGPSDWSGIVLGVAKTQENVIGPAWVAIYGPNMETVIGDRQVASDARELFAMVWTGTEFGLFYRTTGQTLKLQRLTMLGDPIGAAITITPGRPFFAGDELEVVWSPFHDAYVIAHAVGQGSARGLYITVVDENGTQRSDRPVQVLLAERSPIAIDVTDAGVIGVVFITNNNLLALGIMRSVTDTPEVREFGSGGAGELVAAARGERFVIARTATAVDRTVIRWLIVDTSHQVVKGETELVEGSGEDVHPQALLINGDELALSYIDSPVRADTLDDTFRLRRFTITGAVLGDTAFAAGDVSAVRAVSPFPFVWTGEAYMSPGVRRAQNRVTSYLLRYCRLAAQIVAPSRVLVGETVTFTPVASGGVGPYTYEWSFSNSARVQGGEVSVQRTFEQSGTITATLVVTDATGVKTTSTFTFDVVRPRRRAVRN